jgi:hypothetical protein
LLESDVHQSANIASAAGIRSCRLKGRNTLNQTSLENEHCSVMCSIVSGS